jgi:hypothetical protein
MDVIARAILGGAFQQFSRACGPSAFHAASLQMGRLAASAMPPLLDRVRVLLTLDLLRRRITDSQVFGWAEVRTVPLAETLDGVLELDKTFESAHWQGRAGRSDRPVTSSAGLRRGSSPSPSAVISCLKKPLAKRRETLSAESASHLLPDGGPRTHPHYGLRNQIRPSCYLHSEPVDTC